MSEFEMLFWSQFFASALGALVGGGVAAVIAWRVFASERKAASTARKEDATIAAGIRAEDRRLAELDRAKIAQERQEERETLALEDIHELLAEMVLNTSKDPHIVPAIRRLKTCTLRARLVFRDSQPILVRWLENLHWSTALRLAALGLTESRREREGTQPLLADNLAFNTWVTEVGDKLARWQLGEVDDSELELWVSALESERAS